MHGIAFLVTQEVSFTDEGDVVGEKIQKRRFRQGVIIKRPPVSMNGVVLSHAEDALLARPIGVQRHREIEERRRIICEHFSDWDLLKRKYDCAMATTETQNFQHHWRRINKYDSVGLYNTPPFTRLANILRLESEKKSHDMTAETLLL